MTLSNVLKSTGVLSLIFFVNLSHAQFDTSVISSRIEQSKKQLDKNVVFLLYKDGKIIYKKESGEFNMKSQEYIGATSQWLTAALVLTFVQEGKLSLDDKVSDYLPIFAKYKKGYVTIRHCLTHNTGIQSPLGTSGIIGGSKFKSLEDEVNDFASRKDIETNPGTETKYSYIGMNIAARVIEVITKRPFDRSMQERIFRPLTMRNTTFTNDNYNDAMNPSGGARSTASDMINFMAMILQNGMFNKKQVLTPESVKLLNTIQAPSGTIKNAPKSTEGWNYGLGQWIVETNAQGVAAVVSTPSLTGTWPLVDLCRGYAFILFTKYIAKEPARSFYLGIKSTVDEGLPAANCGL
jgi:CubicO group peptidase (beta-lactamase class C family)